MMQMRLIPREGEIEGRPTRGWIHRRYYPWAEDAIADAKLALKDIPTLFVIKREVPAGFEQYWPDAYHWQISEKQPFTGVVGAFYHGRPDFYVVTKGEIWLYPGESPEVVKQKEKEAWERWERRKRSSTSSRKTERRLLE